MTRKLRFTKVKRSPSDTSPDHLAPDNIAIEEQKSGDKISPSAWQRFIPALWFLLEIGGLVFVLIAGMNFLTAPGAKPTNTSACQSKLAGQWQTNWGNLTFEAKSDSEIVGRYEFYNLNRGKVKGQLLGTIDRTTFNFDWQENSEKGPSPNQGKGLFTFSENCQEFTGSYSTGSITNAINWRGKIIPITPVAPKAAPTPKSVPKNDIN